MISLENILSEVPFVEFFIQNNFVQMLQLGKSEFFGQQLKADVVSYQFMTEDIQRTLDDLIVVEG